MGAGRYQAGLDARPDGLDMPAPEELHAQTRDGLRKIAADPDCAGAKHAGFAALIC